MKRLSKGQKKRRKRRRINRVASKMEETIMCRSWPYLLTLIQPAVASKNYYSALFDEERKKQEWEFNKMLLSTGLTIGNHS